jgi:hypothetical protein
MIVWEGSETRMQGVGVGSSGKIRWQLDSNIASRRRLVSTTVCIEHSRRKDAWGNPIALMGVIVSDYTCLVWVSHLTKYFGRKMTKMV